MKSLNKYPIIQRLMAFQKLLKIPHYWFSFQEPKWSCSCKIWPKSGCLKERETYKENIKPEAKSNSAQDCRYLNPTIAFGNKSDIFNKFGINVSWGSQKKKKKSHSNVIFHTAPSYFVKYEFKVKLRGKKRIFSKRLHQSKLSWKTFLCFILFRLKALWTFSPSKTFHNLELIS